VDHLDLNFGCPVRKVTSKGGGAAIPLKPLLLRNIVRAAVQAAGALPVTIKFRIGIDDQHQTHLEAGRIAEEEGCVAVALHARTAAQLYDGEARWEAIAELKQRVRRIPVLGNGDIWEAEDALRMMRTTGCDGVVVGRGCLGRPWLFRDLADVYEGRETQDPPDLGGVVDVMLEHAHGLSGWLGDEGAAMRAFRKHSSWYTKCFPGSAPLRQRLMHVVSLAELEDALAGVDRSQPYPPEAMRVPRGKTGGTQKVSLPPGYLDQLDDDTPPGKDAEAADSGG
jgi:nifR3 family TIM-barrel protein